MGSQIVRLRQTEKSPANIQSKNSFNQQKSYERKLLLEILIYGM